MFVITTREATGRQTHPHLTHQALCVPVGDFSQLGAWRKKLPIHSYLMSMLVHGVIPPVQTVY